MKIFQDIISFLSYPECLETGTLYIHEDDERKKGLASSLIVSCECGYQKDTYTSQTVDTKDNNAG